MKMLFNLLVLGTVASALAIITLGVFSLIFQSVWNLMAWIFSTNSISYFDSSIITMVLAMIFMVGYKLNSTTL